MKKISLLLVCVLMCTLVFANDTDEPTKAASGVAVINCVGSSIVKVYYKAEQAGTVTVSIFNESNKLVFSETLKRVSGFTRPYNFDDLPAGNYAIQIEDRNGVRTEYIDYTAGKIEKLVSIIKLAEEGKYLLSVNSKVTDNISVNIFNEANQLIHSEENKVNQSFAEVLNLKNINHFTIEVSDSKGLLKSLKN